MEDKIFQVGRHSINKTSRLEFFKIIRGQLESVTTNMDKSWEGKLLMFPSLLHHQVYPFYTSDGIRITVSKYYLPSGKSISEVGVAPDILVEEEGKDFKVNSPSDNQLSYAVKLLTIWTKTKCFP